jgi:peroxiredoxin
MKMLKKFLLALVVGGIAATGCGPKENNADKTAASNNHAVSESEKLPDFTLKTLAGNEVNLRQLEGQKVVVVNFWATWCGPCRNEIPDFNDVYSRYRDRGVEFLGVSVDESPETVVPEFLEKIPIAYPVLLGSPDLTYRYGVRGLPTTFIIDRSGKISKRIVGMTFANTLEAELNKLL